MKCVINVNARQKDAALRQRRRRGGAERRGAEQKHGTPDRVIARLVLIARPEIGRLLRATQVTRANEAELIEKKALKLLGKIGN